MTPAQFQELLAKARARAAAMEAVATSSSGEEETTETSGSRSASLADISNNTPISFAAAFSSKTESDVAAESYLEMSRLAHEVDMSMLSVNDETLETEEGQEHAVEVIRELITAHVGEEHSGGDDDNGEADNKLPNTQQPNMGNNEQRSSRILGVARDDITLNSNQQAFHDRVQEGADIVLIGAAGTGKTTSVRKTTRTLLEPIFTSVLEADGTSSLRIEPEKQRLPLIKNSTKWLQQGIPGIFVGAYTRKATNNIRHAVVDEIKEHVNTFHKLLEFEPHFYEIEDPEKPGFFKNTMRFEPGRHADNPLPSELKLIIFEEASMLSTDLYLLIQEAMPHSHQEVFLGDIQQLPPVFGLAILGFKMLSLPVIELTEVYRQALASPIITLAHKLLAGDPAAFTTKTAYRKDLPSPKTGKMTSRLHVPSLEALSISKPEGTVVFQPWQKSLSTDAAILITIQLFSNWEEEGYYNPDEDIILCPYVVSFGTEEINKGIQNYLGHKRGAVVHEVIAGFKIHYYAVGDRVLYDKEDAFITSITPNASYLGKQPQPASVNLDRYGGYSAKLTEEELLAHRAGASMTEEALEDFMLAFATEVEDRVQACSHIIKVQFALSGEEEVLTSAAQVNNLLGGNAISVHKSQGSEYEKVFLILHNTHAKMISRELLYTAVTRAKKSLHIICEPYSFERGVQSQRIKGSTLKEKAEFFRGKGNPDDFEKISVDIERKHHELAHIATPAFTPKEEKEERVPLMKQLTLAERLQQLREQLRATRK